MPKLSFGDRLVRGWNAFINKDPTPRYDPYGMYTSSSRMDRTRLTGGNEKTIVASIYNRLAVDAASIAVMHARVDVNGSYQETINSKLNTCLSVSANKDQTGRALIQDAVLSMFDEGVIAIVPVDTTDDPNLTASFDITQLRVCKIVKWWPDKVTCHIYNEKTGKYQDRTLKKDYVAIVENPFYAVMNERSSTVKRLLNKLRLLDVVDEKTGSGKLDLIIQLPYVIRNDARKAQAESRRRELERQLATSKYGVAYTDGTEKVTQLGHSLDNNLLDQIEYLQKLLYSQLGLTEEILNGSADEKVMMNYYSRTIEPILSAITDEMTRKFLSRTAISQHQKILFMRDPFKLVPVSSVADIADKFTRSRILSSNELRAIIGRKPVADDRANQLINPNLNQSNEEIQNPIMADDQPGASNENQNVNQEVDYAAHSAFVAGFNYKPKRGAPWLRSMKLSELNELIG